MTFAQRLEGIDPAALHARIATATARDVECALARDAPRDEDLPVLFSPAAAGFLEEIARRSATLTLRRFGKVIQLYVPLYLSNECVNRCVYCGFSIDNALPRVTLSRADVLAEAGVLAAHKFRHLLLVSGESRRHVPVDFIAAIAHELKSIFDSVSIEVQPFRRAEYGRLVAAGVDGLCIYQETYDPVRYATLHLAGPKKHFARRLDAIEEGAAAGMRSLGIGVLLGLADWRRDAALLALHGRDLSRRFWRSRIAISFPRIRHAAGDYHPEFAVSDRDLVQMICAMRLALPDAELVLSTRESAALRDNLVGLGITRLSAGSRTNPGGYGVKPHSGEQFEVEDPRSADEVAKMIAARGFEPVFKDFDRTFTAS